MLIWRPRVAGTQTCPSLNRLRGVLFGRSFLSPNPLAQQACCVSRVCVPLLCLQPPLGQRRAMVLSGMFGSEVIEVVSAYKEAGEQNATAALAAVGAWFPAANLVKWLWPLLVCMQARSRLGGRARGWDGSRGWGTRHPWRREPRLSTLSPGPYL